MKGISPLIAAVLLIAFTMAIAGIMATWATTFTKESFSCMGVLKIDSLSFSNGNVSFKIINQGDVALESLSASVEYTDVNKNHVYTLSSYNVSDPLTAGDIQWVIIPTGDTTRPSIVDVRAKNCPENPAILNF